MEREKLRGSKDRIIKSESIGGKGKEKENEVEEDEGDGSSRPTRTISGGLKSSAKSVKWDGQSVKDVLDYRREKKKREAGNRIRSSLSSVEDELVAAAAVAGGGMISPRLLQGSGGEDVIDLIRQNSPAQSSTPTWEAEQNRKRLAKLGKEQPNLLAYLDVRRESVELNLSNLGRPISPKEILAKSGKVIRTNHAPYEYEGEEDLEEDDSSTLAREGADALSTLGERYINLLCKYRERKADLSHLNITAVSKRLTGSGCVEFLTVLNLSHNSIKDAPAHLGQLARLEELNLSHNQITAIAPEVFNLTNLEVLDLSDNQMKFIPDKITQLTRLQELLINNNQLSSIPSTLCSLSSLQTLSLSHNQLDHGWILSNDQDKGNFFAGLLSLDLSLNNFGEIPLSLCGCTALQELNLSHNQLSYVREELPLTNWGNLLILDVSYNRLVKFGPNASRNLCCLAELVVLNLSFNQLTMLPPNLFKLKCLRSLKIAGNPKLQTEIGLSDEIVSMGTKAIIKYLRPSDTITKRQSARQRQIVADITNLIRLSSEDLSSYVSSGGNLSTVSVADTSSSEEFLTPTIRPMLNSGEMRANEIFKDLKIHIAANPYIQQERKKLQTTKTSTMAHSPSSSSSSLSLSAPSTPTKENEKEELRKMRKERKGKDKIMHDDSEPIFRSIYQGESPLNIFGQSLILPCVQWKIKKGMGRLETPVPSTPRISGLVFTESMGDGLQLREEIPDDEEVHIFELEREIVSYYSRYFYSTAHTIMVGEDPSFGPVVVVMTREREVRSKSYWFLLLTQYGSTMGPIQNSSVRARLRLQSTASLVQSLKKTIHPNLKNAELRLVKGNNIKKKLREYEEIQNLIAHKVGIIYCSEGQISEKEIFNNAQGSEEFDKFLGWLGTRVPLKDWDKYAGGLDTEKGHHGTHSVYTNWQGLEIMFHVSTMMPLSATDTQQIERKKHIGNDVVVIVFIEGNTAFSPITIRSHFTHVYIVIHVEKTPQQGTLYKLDVSYMADVPVFGPPVPAVPVFQPNNFFREFLLSKIVNAERAAYQSPALMKGILKSRAILLGELMPTEKGEK